MKMKTRPANPLWKRLQRRWRRFRGFEQAKTHEVDWVWIDGKRQKRIRFASPKQAHEVSVALSALEKTDCFPPLIRHEGRDVWVEYIKKDLGRSEHSDAIILFFTDLYDYQLSRPGKVVPVTPLMADLDDDLNTLCEHQLIDQETAARVNALARQVAPPVLVKGFDYVDAVAKNFVLSNRRAVGIDVEALLADQYLGVGLAKAEYRGLISMPMSELLAQLDGQLVAQYPVVRLSFLTRYFCEKIDQGKPKHIWLSALTDLL